MYASEDDGVMIIFIIRKSNMSNSLMILNLQLHSPLNLEQDKPMLESSLRRRKNSSHQSYWKKLNVKSKSKELDLMSISKILTHSVKEYYHPINSEEFLVK